MCLEFLFRVRLFDVDRACVQVFEVKEMLC